MKFNKKVLKNGVRILSVEMPESQTVTVMVLVEAGSKYENQKTSGLSHFLEHFVFKGTERRPKTSDISRELDSLGAQYNAFTAQEYTGYYAKAHKDKTEKIIDLISDTYLNPTLPEAELEKEKGVVIQEIHMYEDDPARHIQDLFMELLYGDQPAGWNIAGTPEHVASFKREDLVKYRTAQYVGEATAVLISGGFSEKAVTDIESVFSKLNSGPKQDKLKVLESQDKPQVLLKYKKTDQAHLVLGVRAFDVYDPRSATLKVLGAILGAGMSSRLFVKLRDELGLCYYVSAGPDFYTDHGVFSVSVGADTKKVEEAISAVMEELRKISQTIVSEEELRKTKDLMIGNMYLSLESSDELAQFYGMQEVLRRPIKSSEDLVNDIEKVTAEDIQNLATELFKDKSLNLAIIGPYENKESFLKLLKF